MLLGCPDTPPNITNVVASAESVQLEYTPPYTDDPLIEESDLRYAVYLKCGFESNFTLVEDGIRNTTYNISGLLEVTECTAMLVAYSNDCSRELGGRFSDSVVFTTGLLGESSLPAFQDCVHVGYTCRAIFSILQRCHSVLQLETDCTLICLLSAVHSL